MRAFIFQLLRFLPIQVAVFHCFGLEFPSNTMCVLEIFLVTFHVLQESLAPVSSEVNLLYNRIRNIGKIKQNHDHIRLLKSSLLVSFNHFSIISFLILSIPSIFNEFFSFIDTSWNVLEVRLIIVVRNDLIPWCALDCLIGHRSAV